LDHIFVFFNLAGGAEKDCGAASAGYRCTEGRGVKKVVGPRAAREAVRVAREEGKLSERRACGLIGMSRGSWRYRKKERDETALRKRLLALAAERPRFGYRRWHRMLRREKEGGTAKWMVNHKRVYRIYCEEGLAMRRRKGKRFRAEARVPLVPPQRTNQMWTMDFTRDSLASGRKFRTLNLMDGYTREALGIEVDTSFAGAARGTGSGKGGAGAWLAGNDSSGQRTGVHQSHGGPMGLRPWRGVALYRSR